MMGGSCSAHAHRRPMQSRASYLSAVLWNNKPVATSKYLPASCTRWNRKRTKLTYLCAQCTLMMILVHPTSSGPPSRGALPPRPAAPDLPRAGTAARAAVRAAAAAAAAAFHGPGSGHGGGLSLRGAAGVGGSLPGTALPSLDLPICLSTPLNLGIQRNMSALFFL